MSSARKCGFHLDFEDDEWDTPPPNLSPEHVEAWKLAPVAERKRAFLDFILKEMGALPDEPTKAAVRRCSFMWQQFKRACEKQAMRRRSPGEADAVIRSVNTDPRFHWFRKWQVKYYHASPEYKERQRDYDKRRYWVTTKDRRADPAVREKLNAQRRARYAKAKEANRDALGDAHG